MRLRPGCGIALALAASCGMARADGRLDYRVDGDCPVLFRTIEVAGPRLRFEVTPISGGQFVSIFDGDEDLVTSLMTDQRKYLRMEVDADAVDYTGDVASSSVKYMDRQIAEAKKLMEASCGQGGCPQGLDIEAMMRAAMPSTPSIEARATAEVGDAGGLACTWREWVRDGAVVRRECLVKLADLPLPDRDRAGLVRGMRVMLNYGDAMAPMRDRFGAAREPEMVAGQLVARQVCFAAGVETGTAMLGVMQALVDPSRFEIPAGYSPFLGPDSTP
ncbi:MAG: hypothetical protein ACREO3_07520 [Arenimonas sp.]